MKMHEVVIKMAFAIIKQSKLPQILAKLRQKLKFLEAILKVHHTRRENDFKSLNHISFVNWVTKILKVELLIRIWRVRRLAWESELCAL